MKKLLNKHIGNERGLTLIELLAVIVILAIISLIAIPSIGGIISNTKSKAILADANQVLTSAKIAMSAGECGKEVATGNNYTTGTLKCTKDNLTGLSEGLTLVASDYVLRTTYKSSGAEADTYSYEIYYNKFGDLNNKAIYSNVKSSKLAKESELQSLMGN